MEKSQCKHSIGWCNEFQIEKRQALCSGAGRSVPLAKKECGRFIGSRIATG